MINEEIASNYLMEELQGKEKIKEIIEGYLIITDSNTYFVSDELSENEEEIKPKAKYLIISDYYQPEPYDSKDIYEYWYDPEEDYDLEREDN